MAYEYAYLYENPEFGGLAGPQASFTVTKWLYQSFMWTVGNRLERQRKFAKFGEMAVEALDGTEGFYGCLEEAEKGVANWEDPKEHCFPINPSDVRKTLRFAAVVAKEVRVRMGPNPKYSVANEKVAWELAAKIMEERCVRKVDRMRFLPYATKLVFVPTEHDVFAAQIGESAAVAWRLDQAQPRKPWWWWRPWWRLPGLGRPTGG